MSNNNELTHLLYTPQGGSRPAKVENRFGDFTSRSACIAFTGPQLFHADQICDAYAACWRSGLRPPRAGERWPRLMVADVMRLKRACANKHPSAVAARTVFSDTPAGQRAREESRQRAADPEGRLPLPEYAAPSWEAAYYGGKTAREMVGLQPGVVFTGLVQPRPGTTRVIHHPPPDVAPRGGRDESTASGGPLSWGWLALGAGGLALWYYFAKRRKN